MASTEFNLLVAFETHSVKDIRKILDAGFDIAASIKGKSVVNSLTEMYSRSEAFPACLRLLLDRGAVLDDPRIAPVLLDDAAGLRTALRADPSLIGHRTSMISTFTPLLGASLLHVAAEFGNMNAVRVLLEMGAGVNARALVDEYGLNGHTPLFHTVNSNDNRSAPILHALLNAGADPMCGCRAPISYAQLGLLPQVHRREHDIYANIRRLLEAAGRRVPPLDNVPNRYLKPGG